jgi:hypothetical protein
MAYDQYPAVDEDLLFAPVVRAANAATVEFRDRVVPMTQVARNNLSGPDLWNGRTIVNTTTGRINRFDLATAEWRVVVEASDLADLSTALDTRLDAAEAALVTDDGRLDAHDGLIAGHESRLDVLDTGVIDGYTAARVRTTTAGLQDNGFGRMFFDLGFAFRSMPPVITFSRAVSGTEEVDNKRATAFLAYGVVFVEGGDLSLGLSHHITCID